MKMIGKKVIGGLAILGLFALGQAARAEEAAPAQEQQVYMINMQTQEVVLVNAAGDVIAADQAPVQDIQTPAVESNNYNGIGGGVELGPIGGGIHIGRGGIHGGAHVGPIHGGAGVGFWRRGRWHRGRWHRRGGRWAGDWAPYAA
jgi:hypothetical protein